MKDIDFDELDRAVSSLMKPSGQGSKDTKPAETAPQRPTPSPSVQIPTSRETTSSAPQIQATPAVLSSPAAPQPAPGAIKRSPGRFMDVVHPSSDMRTTASPSAPARSSGITPPSRPTPIAPSPPAPAVKSETPKTEATEPKAENLGQDMTFPDPIDTLPTIEAEKEVAQEKPFASAAPSTEEEKLADEVQTVMTHDDSDDAEETLESLFLPNVKVEKRPLGLSSADTSADETATETPETEGTDKKEKTDTLVTPDPTLAELGDDVLAIESDTSTSPSEEGETDETARDDNVMPAAPATPAISSIPRQYSVKQSSDDKHHEALYDTAAQTGSPLQHPAQKKSGWMVILWVILLIVVGVGGALALYFFKVF